MDVVVLKGGRIERHSKQGSISESALLNDKPD
jgi:hypothetical protein